MSDTIQKLKEQHGANSSEAAEQLNSMATELQRGGDIRPALRYHQEALTILEWNKSNALLYDFVEKSREYALEMAVTLHSIGNILREMNNFVGAAEVYKECLDTFLEALIDGGGALKRRLLNFEYKKDYAGCQATLNQVDRKAISRALCLHPEFRSTVRDIGELFNEIQVVKFVGQNAASSRRRRRMAQRSNTEANLKNAVESLSESSNGNEGMKCHQLSKSMPPPSSSATVASGDSEAWIKCFWEKEVGRFSRPRPISRRAITSEEEYDHYKDLSLMIAPSEECLVNALKRFPLPVSLVGTNKQIYEAGSDTDSDTKEQTCNSTASPQSVGTTYF